MEKQQSYRQITKSISLLGGLQVFLILINLIKGKAIALLLGVSGMGNFTLINNILNLMVQFAYLGINFSAMRSISIAMEAKDHKNFSRTYAIFWYWTVFCAFLGLCVTFFGASLISEITFNDEIYKVPVMLLSLGVFFTILSNGNVTLLQGMSKLKEMAKSSFISALIGLFFSIPLFYFFKEKGIVFSIIVTSISSFSCSSFFKKKNYFEKINLNILEVIKEGSDMLKLGLTMMFSTFIGTLVIYIINIFITKFGSIDDLGLFSAGSAITNQYIGLVFTAMAADYFPRLSAVSDDPDKVNEIVNNQGVILLIIICPILLLLLSFSPIIINILLSQKFLAITEFIAIVSFAMIFKAASYPIGYISFAKGDKKVFFLFEGLLNSLLILLGHTLGYYYGGIKGIAIGIFFIYFSYFITVNILAQKKYNFVLKKEYKDLLLYSCFLLIIGLINFLFVDGNTKYLIGILLSIWSLCYSFLEMNKKIDIKKMINTKFPFI